jgi:sulfur-carrier protein adenylyltransferase/sulfurtransferase
MSTRFWMSGNPGEYESEHIPGSKLIPLPELNDRLNEIDPHKPTVVY